MNQETKHSNHFINSFIKHCLNNSSNNGFKLEFDKIQKLQFQPNYRSRMVKVSEEIQKRNRYYDVSCIENSRVKLMNHSIDYINASFIREKKKKKYPYYIAAQAPLKEFIEEFWLMIWQQNVSVILMLTPWNEKINGKKYSKAERYFPTNQNQLFEKYGNFRIVLKNIHKHYQSNHITISELEVDYHDKKRIIYHIHFTLWPDNGHVSDYPLYLNVHKITYEYIQKAKTSSNLSINQPILVHCSAGIGRTGTFIAIDIVLRQLGVLACINNNEGKDKNFNINVLEVVSNLRYQRPSMVTTLTQYIMVYCIIYFVITGKHLRVH